MKNATKITLAAIVSIVVALPALCADKHMSAAVERSVTKATATQESPLEIFKWNILKVYQPENTTQLMDTLQILTAYNKTFEIRRSHPCSVEQL